MKSLGSWIDGVIAHNRTGISAAAACIARTHREGGIVFTAGSGHSLAMVMETFFRAGGLAIVRPLFHLGMLPLNGALKSTMAERKTGAGVEMVATIDLRPKDIVVVFSNSGRNPYPVEIAEEAKRRGAAIVALTSVKVSRATQPRGVHRLHEVADIVLDTLTPPGDVSFPAEEPVTGPLSTLACCALWTEILSATVELDPGIRLWRSANQDGNDGFNARLAQQLRDRIPELWAGYSEEGSSLAVNS